LVASLFTLGVDFKVFIPTVLVVKATVSNSNFNPKKSRGATSSTTFWFKGWF